MKRVLAFAYILMCCSYLQAENDEIEDIFNRFGGPPLYRYYHLLPHHHEQTRRYEDDANNYWGDKYYGNSEPDAYSNYELDREIMELERGQNHPS
jgi:hypothetical protein